MKRLTTRFVITDEEWASLYRKVKFHSNATKVRDFMFRWLILGAYTNKDYETFKIKESAACTYCKFQSQDFFHLFIDCKEVISIRDRLALRWEGNKMTKKDWLLGTHQGDFDRAKNFIAMELNRYIQITNWKGEDLSIKEFKSRMRAIEKTENRIASKKNKLHTHEQKWKPILWLLN